MSSRSGTIRQSISTSKRFLCDRIKQATDFLNEDIPENAECCHEAIDNLTEAQQLLESSIHNIEKKDLEWQNLIQSLEDDDEVKAEQDQYDATAGIEPSGYLFTLNEAQGLICRISTRIRKLNRTLNTFVLNSADTCAAGGRGSAHGSHLLNYNSSNSSGASRVQIPKIVLPTFDGNILKWKEFWSIFNKTIHERADLSGVEKFSYLLPQLQGRARQCIDGFGLLIDDNSYDAAIDILRQRFDSSDDRIISMLYGEFKQVPRCGNQREDKRLTFDTCERIFRQLELAGEDVDSSRALTIDLLSKFPAGMVRDLQRHYSVGVHSKLSDVRIGIDKSITELESTSGILEDLDAISLSNTKPKSVSTTSGRKQYRRPNDNAQNRSSSPDEYRRNNSAFSAVSDTEDTLSESKALTVPSSNCYFCDGRHFNGDCTKYPTARNREQRLYELKRCIKCGRKHNAGGKRSQCNNTQVKCVHCRTKNDHYSALCRIRYPVEKESSISNSVNASIDSQTFATVNESNDITILNNSTSRNALFQTAKVHLVNLETGENSTVRMCLDSLSNRSYITEKAADKLKLTSNRSDNLVVSVFGSQKSIEVPTRMVEFGIVQADGSIRNIEANTTRIISNSGVLPKVWPAKELELLDSMKRTCTLADDPFDDDKSVDVLVGADYAWEFITGGKIGTSTGIYFIPSTLGLMLAGQLRYDDCSSNDNASTMLCIFHTPHIHEMGLLAASSGTPIQPNYPDVDEYWKLESIGITDCPVENDDEKALDTFCKTVYYDGERYHVAWPWIEEKRCLLPSNYDVALRRFRSLSTRLKLNSDLLEGYRNVIATQLERGIIEKLPEDQISTSNNVHYLPHHPVIKSSSATTKIRIVYDASSKLRNHDVSLNECLLRGPVILPDMCQLLMRFRVHENAVISDIEKAFLQVALQLPERDVTRFLWYQDDKQPGLVAGNIAVYRFCRVAFGIISSPFLLGATIQYHLLNQRSSFADALSKDIYVDNVISGIDGNEKLIDYYHKVKSVFATAGMNLQEFCSNSKELMSYIPRCDRVKITDVKVLGMKWDSQDGDTIRISKPLKWDMTVELTKRTVLQSIAAIFDPLGLFQPVFFTAKLFLQRLWQLEMPWDASIDKELKTEWDSIVVSTHDIFDFRIPRYIGNVSETSTLMVFSDASAKGYGVAVYLRCQNGSTKWVSNLIFAKSRLSPIVNRTNSRRRSSVPVTLPRLELLGATIAATAANFCRNAFSVPDLKVHFFIDSECVLQWIKSKQVLKRFVARRVEKIRCVNNCIFHYVDTADNPADYLTRGKTANELKHDMKWWHGPVWLSDVETNWPKTRLENTSDEVLREIAAEVKPTNVCHTLAAASDHTGTGGDLTEKCFIGIDPKKLSSLRRLLRMTIICLKFLRERVWNRLSCETREGCVLQPIFGGISDGVMITARDITFATHHWVRHVQSTFFEDLKIAIETNQRNAMITQLGLQLDDGLIRSHSRFANADLPDESKYPLLLPKRCRVAELVVKDVHERLRHSGVSHTLSEIRKRYWIPQGRSFVKQVLRQCFVCRIFKTSVPFALPDMPPWPPERVSESVPFQFTGLDYFGPIKVRVNDTTQKMWACLFSCLATRAIHLEAVVDCTPPEFLNCLIRFISRRGCPQQIISDNAAQFHLTKILGDRAWTRLPTDENLLSYAANSGIQWKFIVELAPWQGGHYERLVGVVKSVLKTAVGRRLLSWTDLITLLTETEAIVNSRPITYVGDDVASHMRTLRPVDFLVNRPVSVATNENDFPLRDLGDSGKRLAAIWKQRKRHLDKLWQHWYEEYLTSLRERGKAVHRRGRCRIIRSPREGEVVLLHDKDLPRGSWRLAKITRLIYSADQKIRAAEIKLSNGVLLRRAVNFLIPLEVEQNCAVTNDDTGVRAVEPSIDISDADSNANDDDGFHGFTPEEVQRTIDAIQRVSTTNDVERPLN